MNPPKSSISRLIPNLTSDSLGLLTSLYLHHQFIMATECDDISTSSCCTLSYCLYFPGLYVTLDTIKLLSRWHHTPIHHTRGCPTMTWFHGSCTIVKIYQSGYKLRKSLVRVEVSTTLGVIRICSLVFREFLSLGCTYVQNLCGHLQEEFLRIPKHPQLVKFGWFWAKLWHFEKRDVLR